MTRTQNTKKLLLPNFCGQKISWFSWFLKILYIKSKEFIWFTLWFWQIHENFRPWKFGAIQYWCTCYLSIIVTRSPWKKGVSFHGLLMLQWLVNYFAFPFLENQCLIIKWSNLPLFSVSVVMGHKSLLAGLLRESLGPGKVLTLGS